MPGQPKRDRVVNAMREIAQEEQGPAATPLDFICSRLQQGLVLREIVDELMARLGESMAVEWVRGVVVKLEPGAKEKMAEARALGASRFLEDALAIADEPAHSTTDVQRNRLRAEVRRDLARSFDPGLREGKGSAPAVAVSFGVLLLAAHKEIAKQEREALPAEIVTDEPAALMSGATTPALAGETTDVEVVSE